MKSPHSQKGFALALVLIVIVLVTAIAVAFLASTAREQRAVSTYADSAQAGQIGNMAVRRVMGQIGAATTESTPQARVSWASQPGMIRTYSANGQPRSVYKLYSWDDVVTPGVDFDPLAAAEIPPPDWTASPALFTDINQPIQGIFPIMDPAAEGVVEGFSISRGADSPVTDQNPGAMPVKWLYILEDGQMVPASGSGRQVTVAGASQENPIVGRVAFWTDDETSKVNINTASEGAFWDWPKGATPNEMLLAANPPVGNEFNRVPGHPAMTSLSAVFPELAPGAPWSGLPQFRQKLSTLLSVAPRVPHAQASSRGGTFPIEIQNFEFGPRAGQSFGLPVPNAPLTPRSDRLYASPQEIVFEWPGRQLSQNLTVDMVTGREFFLTSASRAPETTLFDTPRISLWPVTWSWPSGHALLTNRQNPASGTGAVNPNTTPIEQNQWMRAEERLLAFAATLNRLRPGGGDRYFFQRQNPENPTHDFSNIARNRELMGYLQRLTSQNIPGFGGDFSSKFGASTRDQILANAFNIIRSSVNQYTLQNDGRMLYSYTPIAFANFRRWNNTVVTTGYNEPGAFSPVPLRMNLGSGDITTISDFPLLREASLVFFATDRRLPVSPTIPPGLPDDERHRIQSNPYNWQHLINTNPSISYPVGSQTTSMRATLLLEFASRRGASGFNQPRFWVKITSASMSAAGQSLVFNDAVAQIDLRTVGSGVNLPSFMHPLVTKDANGRPNGAKTFIPGNVTESNYGLISLPINLDPNATEFPFSGGVLTVELFALRDGNPAVDPTSDSSLRIATYQVDFSSWNGSHGIPLAPRWNYYEIREGTPQDFPNPRFQVHDPSRPTTWAATEIAPGIRTAYSSSDPAVAATPTSIWPLSTLYNTNNTNGSIILPTNNNPFGRATAYIFDSQSGRIMTDFARRIRATPNLSGLTEVLNAATGTGRQLNARFEAVNISGFPAITPYDTVLSVVPDPAGPGGGDPRLARNFTFRRVDEVLGGGSILRQVMPLSDYPRINRQFHTLGAGNQQFGLTGYISSNLFSLLHPAVAPNGMAQFGATTKDGFLGSPGGTVGDDNVVGVLSAMPGELISNNSVGDWSSQPGYLPDGGIIPRPDQDFQSIVPGAVDDLSHQTPYFSFLGSTLSGIISDSAIGYFSPNRQIPSPITILGAIPSSQSVGWQTLCFSPNPASGATHPGLQSLRDHVLLDFFWMPVVEPYPISEEFSTAGKVNLNYRIAPFSYITRRTALHAVLRSTELAAMSNSLAANYKSAHQARQAAGNQSRFTIDAAQTLDRVDNQVFNAGNIFRSASQIAEVWLVPEGRTAQNVEQFWTDKLLTSDTAREQPYDHLYSRLTTKSNTYNVHWKAQVLRKVPSTDPGIWNEDLDRVASELRGSALIERFLDPNATDIPDYATNPDAETLGNFYKWRTVVSSLFQP